MFDTTRSAYFLGSINTRHELCKLVHNCFPKPIVVTQVFSVMGRYMFMLIDYQSSAPSDIVIATYSIRQTKASTVLEYRFTQESSASLDAAVCPISMLDHSSVQNPEWRQGCVQYAAALATLDSLPVGTLLHVQRTLAVTPGGEDVHLIRNEGMGKFTSVEPKGRIGREFTLGTGLLASSWPVILDPETVSPANNSLDARNGIHCGGYAFRLQPDSLGCHTLLGAIPEAGFSPMISRELKARRHKFI